jgi:chromosome segregation ATPase
MDKVFKTCKTRDEKQEAHRKLIEKLQEEAISMRVDDYEAHTISTDIISAYKTIASKIDLLKKKAEGRSEVKATKDDEKKMNKLKASQEAIKVKYNSNFEMKHVCERKVEKIDNDIDELKEKYDAKETDIRDKAEKKIEAKKKKIEEYEDAIKKLKDQIEDVEKDIEKIEEDTEYKIKENTKARRRSIDKKMEDKELSLKYIEDVLNKRQEEYETQLTNISNEYDNMSNGAKMALLASDIKQIEESKQTIKDKISMTEAQLEVYNNILPKLEQLNKKYFVDDDDYDEITMNYTNNYIDMIKVHINDIKDYPEKLNTLLEQINKIL